VAVPPPTEPSEPTHRYPGDEKSPSYRWAFSAWIILFLTVICLGLINYLATVFKHS